MEKVVSLDLKIFEKNFPKEWINELANRFSDFILQHERGFSLNNYYELPGNWGTNRYTSNDNDLYLDKRISDYFERLLYFSNIFILNYVLENLEEFQKLKFFDFGSGLGLLSVFLKKIDIECYNYDNFKGMPNIVVEEDLFYKDYQVISPSRVIPKSSMDVFACSGISLPKHKKYLKYMENDFKYLMIDSGNFDSNRGGLFYDLNREIDFLSPWNKTDKTKNFGLGDMFKGYKKYKMVEDNERAFIIFKRIFK